MLISFFWVNRVSPLSTYIEVCVTCEETGDPIEGLKVWASNPSINYAEYKHTGANGCTDKFGSGFPDGTYTIEFFWNGQFSYQVEINCSKITWQFDYTVPNPTITKHFFYEKPYDTTPIVGLNVSLYEDCVYKTSSLTSASGTVVFDGSLVSICHNYTMKYDWGGTQFEIPADPIHFALVDGELLECAWEETNYLSLKSGGDKTTLG